MNNKISYDNKFLIFAILLLSCQISCLSLQKKEIKSDNQQFNDITGPVISVTKPEHNDIITDNLISIKANVYDGSGINKIIINDRETIPLPDLKSYPIHYKYELLPDEDNINIKAYDIYDNISICKIPLIIENDNNKNLIIDIWNMNENENTFSENIIFEGAVYDKTGIKDLLINNKSILNYPAQNIHFCEKIGLNTGLNTIQITAKNASNLTRTKVFKIFRQNNEITNCKKIYNLAISPVSFTNTEIINDNDSITKLITYKDFDNFFLVINNQTCFNVIERGELPSIREERHRSSHPAYISLDTMTALGKEIGANAILFIEVLQDLQNKQTICIILKLINVETNQVIASTIYIRKKNYISIENKEKLSIELIRRLIDNLVFHNIY